jgi:hypothetical protein
MRKLSSFLLVSILSLAPVAQADTIHLKNGSILKGKVASFADDPTINSSSCSIQAQADI